MTKKIKHNTIALCKEREKIKLIDASRTDSAKMEIELIHSNGFIVFAVKDTKWQQWSFKKEEINHNFIQNLLGLELDTYVSMNSFKSPRKLISNLYSLNALWSDIDYYNIEEYKNKSYKEMIDIISKNPLLKKIPPSFWIYSGRGLYPIWLIENAYAKTCIALWKKLMDTIHKSLEPYGADPKSIEPSHVLRFVGSNNTKTNNKSVLEKEILQKEFKRYTLNELSEKILPKLKYTSEEWNKLIRKNKSKKNKEGSQVKLNNENAQIYTMFNTHTLNYARMQDVQALIQLRHGKCVGMREFLLFLYRYWGNCFYSNAERALNEILELNNMFEEPLSESEVINATEKAEEAAQIWEAKIKEYFALEKKPLVKKFFDKTGCYIYSNKALIKKLKITYDEMIALNEDNKFILQTIINSDAIRYRKNYKEKEKKKLARRNEYGLTPKSQAKMDKIYAILDFMEQGLKQVEMAEKLGVKKSLISMYVKEIKEKNITKPVENVQVEDNVIELNRITDTELSFIVV